MAGEAGPRRLRPVRSADVRRALVVVRCLVRCLVLVARGSQCVVWVYNSYGAYCWGLGRCLALMRVKFVEP